MDLRKQRALHALLTTNNYSQAAAKAGISTRTLYRYLNEDAEFRKKYDESTSGLVIEAAAMLKKSFVPAIDRLQKLVLDESINAAVSVQAARVVLDYGLKLVETEDILKRLAALEAVADSTEGGGSIWKA